MSDSSNDEITNGHNGLREFGNCRLDVRNRFLWCGDVHVELPPKALELLCVLVEKRGDIVTKEEIWDRVWHDAFVEETNLTHNIYLLRKALKDLGQPDLIKTVPRRGYRFTAEVRDVPDPQFVVERHRRTRTQIEITEEQVRPEAALTGRPGFLTRHRTAAAIGAVALLLAGIITFAAFRYRQTAAIEEITSIAVLPVEKMGEISDESLPMRITDALITKLGGLKGIEVRPTASIIRFRGKDKDAIEAGRLLGVNAVLDGRVQEEGDNLRVTLQLLRVDSGEQIWSEQFDGKTDRLLGLQDRVSAKVVESLNQNRSTALQLAERPTASDDAYEAYLKGRFFANRNDAASLRKSMDFYKLALSHDQRFAEAWSGLADSQYRLFFNDVDPSPVNVTEARANLRTALDLKPDSANALVTQGLIQMTNDWDWAGAEESYRRAIELEPNSPLTRMRYAGLLSYRGRFDEAITESQMAIRLNPLSAGMYSGLGFSYFCKKDFDTAEKHFLKALELDDKFSPAHWYLSRALWMDGRREESLTHVLNGLRSDGGNDDLAARLENMRQKEAPEAVIRVLIDDWTARRIRTNSLSIACRLASIGENEKAMEMLEEAVAERHPWAVSIPVLPDFDNLKGDPRYSELLRKLNF